MLIQRDLGYPDAYPTAVVLLAGLALIIMILWTFLPFAVFGIKGLLTNILDEQRRTTAAVNSLRSDFRTAAEKALGEPKRPSEGRVAHL